MIHASIILDDYKEVISGVVDKIALQLYSRDFSANSPYLMHGNAGIALFLYHYAVWKGNVDYYKKASALLMDSLKKTALNRNKVKSVRNDLSFSKGAGGLGWLLKYLLDNDIIEVDIDDLMLAVDPWIFKKMIFALNDDAPGMLDGAAGMALYALKRDTELSAVFLERLIKELHERLDRGLEISWQPDMSLLNGWPGLLSVLFKIRAGHPDLDLLEDVISMLFDRINRKNGKTAVVSPDATGSKYYGLGDSDIGMLICRAKCNDNRNVLQALAGYGPRVSTQIVLSGIPEAGLLGGSISTMYLFWRLSRATGMDEFSGVVNNFAERLFVSESGDNDFPGFLYTGINGVYGLNYGLLGGISGIGLALMTMISGENPIWDECLLLN